MNAGDRANARAFIKAYREVWYYGKTILPRGLECREWENAEIVLDMEGCPLTSFEARHLNLKYAKQEFLWYLRGDRFDSSIEQHATMWKKLQQPDGGYNSNYGQYIFPNQFNWVISQLDKDTDSRQASIVLLRPEHLVEGNTDVLCTYGINFRIRQGRLNMTVMMRSNDIIFGMTNDVFCFAMLYRLVYGALLEFYPNLTKGEYIHLVNSLHVYSRHYEMINQIIEGGAPSFKTIDIPWPTTEEVKRCLISPTKVHGPLTEWLSAD
jgi:thymidylate synthase